MCPWPHDSSRKLLSMNARLDYRLHVSAFKRCEGEQSGYLVFSVFTSYHSSRI